MMPRMRQALVEFEMIEDAISCVSTCQVSCVAMQYTENICNF